jgi:hypothetical protein
MTISGSNSGGVRLGYAQTINMGDNDAGTPPAGNLTGNNGIATKAGNSRTITVQLKGALYPATTVVDGYTLKFADKKVDMLGNITTTNTYVASSGGTAAYTVTCGADNDVLVNAADAGSASYWEAHEVTVSEATAAGTGAGVSRPTGSSALTFAYSGDGQHNDTMNISCDDAVPAFTAHASNSQTLEISSNNYASATAGSLSSVTFTAYDQYGDGIVGQTANFQSDTDGGGAATQATLTTGADGSSTLQAIACSGVLGAAGTKKVAWSIEGTGVTATAMTASTPTHLVDGTTIYCTTPVNQDGVYGTQATATDQITLATASQGDTNKGNITLTICNNSLIDHPLYPALCAGLIGAPLCQTTANIDAISANMGAACQTQLRALGMLDNNTTCAASGGNTILTITYLPANQGEFTTAVNLVGTVTDSSDNATTFAVTHTTAGTATENWEYIDNNAADNTIIVSNAYEYATSAGAAATTETYHVITYDSTDVFIIDATDGDVATAAAKVGASETEFETEMASLTALATDISGTEVEGALTSGISVWKIGA